MRVKCQVHLVGSVALVVLSACRFGFEAAASGDGGLDGDDAIASTPNLVFRTAQPFTGDLGGRAGADQKCRDAAAAAGVPGEFAAVLWGSGDIPPSAAFAGSRGWVALDGTPIADHPRDLDGPSLYPIRVTETGAAATTIAWYGGPAAASGTCSDWSTTTTGAAQPHIVPVHGSLDTTTYSNCTDPGALLCAERGRSAIVTVPVETGRIAFITGVWTPSGGLAGADAVCQSAADVVGFTGTFRAYLATSTASADSRFSAAGLPWRRVDGARITDTAAELVGPTPIPIWKTFIAQTATGAHTNLRVFTGTAANNCSDWTTQATSGAIGESMSALRSRLLLFTMVPCTTGVGLICLEM